MTDCFGSWFRGQLAVNHFRQVSTNTQGILCLLAALAALTTSDAIIKLLSPRYALHEIMLFRASFAMVVVLVIVRLEGGFHLLKTRRPVLHLFRGSLFVLANMFFFLGLAQLPMAETVALFFSAPLFICLLAQPLLGERVSAERWMAILIGLAGILMIIRPGMGVFSPVSLLPVLAALTYAGMQMITRKLGLQDKAGTLTFYVQVAFILICAVSGLLIGDGRLSRSDNISLVFLLRAWVWPAPQDLLLLALCGGIVSIGAYFLSQAYRLAQASAVAPFEYASMPFALLLGYFLWNEWPDWQSMGGTLLIILGGLVVLYSERRSRSRALQLRIRGRCS